MVEGVNPWFWGYACSPDQHLGTKVQPPQRRTGVQTGGRCENAGWKDLGGIPRTPPSEPQTARVNQTRAEATSQVVHTAHGLRSGVGVPVTLQAGQ